MTAGTSAPAAPQAAPLRPPEQVMRLERMGSFFSTRLSFMPTLLRRICAEGWSIERTRWALDEEGFGQAVYAVDCGVRRYALVAVSQPLDPAQRTDRVIAEAWDASFALFDGIPNEADLDRLSRALPRQEAARYEPTELVLSRANKSMRFFGHVVERLSAGLQPDEDMLREVGYLMRTTAVYGNGKFGIADRARIAERPELNGPFRAEMLTIYLIRCFTLDLVEHVARHLGGRRFTPMEPRLKRHLGIGNATGLGMAPFLASHPVLIHNWMQARETALARVRGVEHAQADRIERLRSLLGRARRHLEEWRVEDARQSARIAVLRRELEEIELWSAADGAFCDRLPWDAFYRRVDSRFSVEAQELSVSLLIELYPELVDDLAETMASRAETRFAPEMRLGRLKEILEDRYRWALALDLDDPRQRQLFWYTSEEKLEPRLGHRFAEPGADKEMPLAIARYVQGLADALRAADPKQSAAEFLLARPELRSAVRRVQTTALHPYGEIYDNLIGADCLPIDLLRCKLSFFGASKFDPRSDRWTRITMYQGAPVPDELHRSGAADWCFPFLSARR